MRARERLVRADDQLLRLGDGTDALGQRLCVLGAVTVRDGNALQLRVDALTKIINEGANVSRSSRSQTGPRQA